MKLNCDITRQVVEALQTHGVACYIVGGYVRDALLGVESKDIDIEIHGIEMEAALELISKITPAKLFGNFGVISLDNVNTEFALARTEVKTGELHTDFAVQFITNGDLKLAASRRDFTINSIMFDLQNNQIIDNYDGISDLKLGIIRHVSDSFSEDPLRVLRGFKFAARYNFIICEDTLQLCNDIADQLLHLPIVRIEQELNAIFKYDGFKSINSQLAKVLSIMNNSGYYLYDFENVQWELNQLLFFRQFTNFKTVIDNCFEKKKTKKDLIYLIENYDNIINYNNLSANSKYELLTEIKYVTKEVFMINPDLKIIYETYIQLLSKYNGNYFIKKGFCGKQIPKEQKKIIGEFLDEL